MFTKRRNSQITRQFTNVEKIWKNLSNRSIRRPKLKFNCITSFRRLKMTEREYFPSYILQILLNISINDDKANNIFIISGHTVERVIEYKYLKKKEKFS